MEGTYIRVGATNKPADMEMIMELERQRRNVSFDEELDYDLSDKALNLERLKNDFREYTGRVMTENDLFNMRILKTEHDRVYPTFGGVLLASKAIYMEYARVKCARFRGTVMDDFIDQKEFTGPLYHQVEMAMKFAELYIAKSGKVERLQRIDRYEVPLEAIREAIVNAVVHRDYSISGADTKFAIFDDRLEITSPGALPRSLEIEDIIAGRSEIRNKVIARFFREINFIEQWGTGIRKIIRLLENHGLNPPQFKESGLFFKIIISKEKIAETVKPATLKTSAKKTSAKKIEKLAPRNYPQETISKKTNAGKPLSINDPQETTSKKTTSKKIKKLAPRKLKNYPQETISKKTSVGKLPSINDPQETTSRKTSAKKQRKLAPRNYLQKTRARRTLKISSGIIKAVRKKPGITLAELAKKFHMTKAGVRYHLMNLKEKGVLKRIGNSRHGYWELSEDAK
jgi:ATP-dependent DNA helicase RecG